MPVTPNRIAQTSSEAKKEHKKNGPRIPARQQKQLERAFELDQRAARIREAEERRKAAKKKRGEREEKEAHARKQTGVGLATQLIGYSHTQAQLKSGMEAFLGVKKRQDEEKRRKEAELAKRLEFTADNIDKEPWDDDEVDDIALDLPGVNVSGEEQWIVDELDDDTFLKAEDLVVSDSINETLDPALMRPALSSSLLPKPSEQSPVKEDPNFVRLHGPINKAMEAILDKLPEPLIELLSQDLSMKVPDWNPELSLLHKLNPIGLPPHRLRIKVGCAVTLLRDLNTSSQLSKSQHLQILRAENERLECLVLDGQLQGTKTFLTRVAFIARYKNQEQYPFQRTQFPIRVANDYIPNNCARDTSQSGFKLPSMLGHVRPSSLPKRPVTTVTKLDAQIRSNPGFKLPGLPASKSGSSTLSKPTPPIYSCSLDGWDDFLESGTQIARELAVEAMPAPKLPKATTSASPSIADSLPPLSTQDLDFSLEDLDEVASPQATDPATVQAVPGPAKLRSPLLSGQPVTKPRDFRTEAPLSKARTSSTTHSTTISVSKISTKSATKSESLSSTIASCKPSVPLPTRKPPSVSDRPGLKRKSWAVQRNNSLPPPKRPCVPLSHSSLPTKPAVALTTQSSFNDFIISTQEAASFFDDDDSLSFGSPPIAT
ncbi:Nn.00g011880.m01.CDS01 [Neocucurbitaria sp. VM-36]